MLNVIKSKWICLGISLVIILAGVVSYFIHGGFNLDIDFTGGTTLTIDMEGKDYNIADIEKLINDTVGFPASSVQKAEGKVIINISTPKGYIEQAAGTTVTNAEATDATVTEIPAEGTAQVANQVEGAALSPENRTKLFAAVQAKYGLSDTALTDFDSIDPTIGKELQSSAIWCCLIALILMLVYITIRFELWSGIAAVLSLAHNVLILMAIYAIFQLNINTTFIAAILTIVGYSINDTIVTFDRIREIGRKVRKTPFNDIVNRGVNETLTRSINTSVTTLLTIIILYIVGVPSIKEFAMPIILGIIVGTYSSIFIASPIWSLFKKENSANIK